MKLQVITQIQRIEFDIAKRELIVYHSEETEPIKNAINELNLNSTLLKTEQIIVIPRFNEIFVYSSQQ